MKMSWENFTSWAVSGEPSEKAASGRSVNSAQSSEAGYSTVSQTRQ
jgi:hypothetical protein